MNRHISEHLLFTKPLEKVISKFVRGFLPEEKRYWILIPLTGIFSGLLSVALQWVLGLVQALAWGRERGLDEVVLDAAKTSPWRILIIPLAGGIIVAACLPFLRRKGEFQGTSALLDALAFQKGRIPALRSILQGLVSIIAVGMGASLGREGAMIQSGAATGSWLGSRFRLEDHHVKMLLACGAAGGMAASYNVPIGASIFAMEVLLGSFALEIFGPIIICCVISTTISHLLLGGLPAYEIPLYKLVSMWEILLDIALGIGIGCVSVAFIHIFSGLGDLFRWLRPIERVKPVAAMLIIGLVGMRFPAILGNGYDAVNHVLRGEESFPIYLLLLLPVLKILATAVCRTGSVPGGLFTPSLFVGALLGMAFGTMVNWAFGEGNVAKPGAYALVGMGAILAGTIQAPITAVLMIFEMTRDYEIILPLMSACIASALVSHIFRQGSLYTAPLFRRGIRLPGAMPPSWLHEPIVRSVLEPHVTTVSPAERFEEVVEKFMKAPEGEHHLYVTGQEGRFLGSISLHEIKLYFRETQHLESVIAADVVNSSSAHVFVNDPVSRAVLILSETNAERLPVLDNPESRRLLGTVSKRRLLSAYTEANLARLTAKRAEA